MMKKVTGLLLVLATLLLMPGIALAQGAAEEPTAVDTGTTAWMLTSTALVLLMTPGLAMFYGGLVRTKNVIGTMMHSFAAMAIVGVLWAIVGYAMTFGTSHGWCGWDSSKFLLSGIDSKIRASGIPEVVFAMFQGKFAIITPALIAGAFAERVKFRGYCLFIILWSILIYNPLAHWVWGGGFMTGLAKDFAGGTVIHISAGVSGLVMVLYLGSRRGYPKTAMHPNNLVMTLMGAGLLWVGWFGFNAGSSESSGLLTGQALTVTQVAAATGAVTWMLIEALHHGKATSLGFVSGMLAGLVAITPAAGDVMVPGSIVLGIAASVVCYMALRLKAKLGYDDSLDVFGIHGIAGIVGALLLTFFLRNVPDCGIAKQFYYQAEGVVVSSVYAGILTLLITIFVEKTVGLKLGDTGEMAGMDHSLHGESGYGMINMN